jgi:hypothetical protein
MATGNDGLPHPPQCGVPGIVIFYPRCRKGRINTDESFVAMTAGAL